MLQSLFQERQHGGGTVVRGRGLGSGVHCRRYPITTTHTVFSAASGWCRVQGVVPHRRRGFLSQAPRPEAQRADSAGRGLQAVGTPGDSGLLSWVHLQMVVLMDPMEDPDDILRAHRSREKSYLFDVAFDFTATQVRGERGLETHGEKKKLSTPHPARQFLGGGVGGRSPFPQHLLKGTLPEALPTCELFTHLSFCRPDIM